MVALSNAFYLLFWSYYHFASYLQIRQLYMSWHESKENLIMKRTMWRFCSKPLSKLISTIMWDISLIPWTTSETFNPEFESLKINPRKDDMTCNASSCRKILSEPDPNWWRKSPLMIEGLNPNSIISIGYLDQIQMQEIEALAHNPWRRTTHNFGVEKKIIAL